MINPFSFLNSAFILDGYLFHSTSLLSPKIPIIFVKPDHFLFVLFSLLPRTASSVVPAELLLSLLHFFSLFYSLQKEII
nr:MAG TPA: hypothetical protein [Caudoviricetes sp.]